MQTSFNPRLFRVRIARRQDRAVPLGDEFDAFWQRDEVRQTTRCRRGADSSSSRNPIHSTTRNQKKKEKKNHKQEKPKKTRDNKPNVHLVYQDLGPVRILDAVE